jgi:hypothetical protein
MARTRGHRRCTCGQSQGYSYTLFPSIKFAESMRLAAMGYHFRKLSEAYGES